MNYPIPPDLIQKYFTHIPRMIAELSYLNQEMAIEFARDWGEKRKPVTPLYDELFECLSKYKEEVVTV